MGKPDLAEKIYADLKNTDRNSPQAYRALGSYFASSGQRDKAAVELHSLLSAHPKDAVVRDELIEILLDLNRVEEATAFDRDAIRADPADPSALLSEGRILVSQKQYDKAAVVLEAAVKNTPRSASAYFFLGLAQQGSGLPDLATASFSRALEIEPQLGLASAALSNAAVKAGNSDAALQHAETARETDPNLPAVYVATGSALLAKGDLPGAESALLEALRRDPVSLPALATLLKLYNQQGRIPQVLQRISTLSQQNPQNAGLEFLLGLAYYSLKDPDRAELCLHQAIALDPKIPDAYTLLANIRLDRGATEDAKKYLRAAITDHPRSLINYVILTTQYEKEGDWNEARKVCEKAHDIDPNAPMVADELAYLYLEHGGDVNMAVSLAQRAKQKMPESPVAADALGWAYYKIGSINSALVELKQASNAVPSNPVYRYHLGMAFLASRQYEIGRQALRAAIRIDPNFLHATDARAALEQPDPTSR